MLCIFWLSGLVPHCPSNLFSKFYLPFANTSISIDIDSEFGYCLIKSVRICDTKIEISSKNGIIICNLSLGWTNISEIG
jgi:hypothetical protein